VPIVTLALDYSTRTIHVGAPFTASADFAADLAVLRRRFTSAMAYRPERYADPGLPAGPDESQAAARPAARRE
jgi:hypothetical protein